MSEAIMSAVDVGDRLAISDVLIRYATALDGRDWELLASCFTDDATLDYDTSGTYGRDAFVEHCRAGLARMKATQHCVTNHVISTDGDRAHSTSYVIAQHVRENDVTSPSAAPTATTWCVSVPDGGSPAGASSPRGRPASCGTDPRLRFHVTAGRT